MNVQIAIDSIRQSGQHPAICPLPCTEFEVARINRQSASLFGISIPQAYKTFLLHSNGFSHNGLVILPGKPELGFAVDYIRANSEYRLFDDRLIYFGTYRDMIFAYEKATSQYHAVEYSLAGFCTTFGNAAMMFEAMFKMALDDIPY